MYKFLFLIFSLCLSLVSIAQIGNEDGHNDIVISQAIRTVEKLQAKKNKEVLAEFVECGFQEKKMFKKNISGKNLKWIGEVVNEYGFPPKEEIDISEWKVTSASGENAHSTTINVSFYFKRDQDSFSHINDRISLNFKMNEKGEYLLNGIMIFKKEDFLEIKKIINNMP